MRVMADVIPFSSYKNAEQRGSPDGEQTLEADAALGDVASILRALISDEADRHALAQLSASLLALLPLVKHEPSSTWALDELYEAARRFVYDRGTNSQFASESRQELYAAYGAFRAQVVAVSAKSLPATATR